MDDEETSVDRRIKMIAGTQQPAKLLSKRFHRTDSTSFEDDNGGLRCVISTSNSNPSTGLTNSLATSAARTALCFQAHYVPQHKGCRPAEGKEPALDSVSHACGFAGNTPVLLLSTYHKRGMRTYPVTHQALWET